VFGGRADLKFTGGQTNRVVAQRELEILDEMTANRDPKIWAAAQGKDYKVDDSNTQPFIPVPTNRPGAGPDGAHVFLGGEEAIAKMTVAEGMKVNLFASEEKFPELVGTAADAVRSPGPPLVHRVAVLHALEAQGRARRQAPRLRGHGRRRQGGQVQPSSPATSIIPRASSSGTAASSSPRPRTSSS